MNKFINLIKKEYLRLIALIFIFIFAFLPLITLLINIRGNDISYVFTDSQFWLSLKNSLIYSFLSAIITLVLATISAYLLSESSLKHKNVFATLLTLAMLVPTLSIGLGIRVLFGTNGFLDNIFHISLDVSGIPGLIIASVISSFPITFILIYNSLKYEDKSPYDAAEIMGISRISLFFRVKLPYLKVALISAFFASFTLIFSDYGIPMELAGKTLTLPIYLYNQVLTNFEYGRGSIAGLFLLIPALISFIFDLIFKDNTNKEVGKKLLKSSKTFNIVTSVLLVVIAIILFIPQISFISLSLMKSYPNDMSISLINFKKMFESCYGLKISKYLTNSLEIALLTSIYGVIIAYIFAYLSVRKEGKMGKVVNLLSVSTIALPGLVLGLGYMILFKSTKGFFYGTFAILVVVNIIHFFGSPYLLARNSLSKINKDYEVIGETLGLSRLEIFFKVLIPNSISTLIEMFSYFFINSMITISAVTFLCNYRNQPLAVLINTYEKSGYYEMQAAISVIILLINLFAKIIFNSITTLIKVKNKKKENKTMDLSLYQFELLTFLEKNGKGRYSQRFLSDTLTLSLGTVNKLLQSVCDESLAQVDSNNNLSITDKGLKALEPYRVRKAIILAAGFGSRLAPVTLDTPKPLVKVNGVRIIDTLLDALIEKGITSIYIVRGYMKEEFDSLLEKYPTIKFIDNPEFNTANNITSLYQALDVLDSCYICEADLMIKNKDIIRKYEYKTNYLGAKVKETDDWCFKKTNGFISSYLRGGENCYQAYGISYWNSEDSEKLKADITKVYNSRGGKENLWENVPLKIAKKNYKVEIRTCLKSDITEIDNFSELLAIDESYNNYPGSEKFR